MSRKRQKKTSLKSAILLLLLMAVLLVTSSYAWFTANKTVTVSSLTVNVQAANGLQISVDGQNWKAVISNADLTTAVESYYSKNTNQIPTELAPVSTVGTVSDGNMQMYYGTVDTNTDGDFVLSAEQETDTKGTEGHYIVFDIFLKVSSQTPIYLTTDSGVESNGEDTGLKNAARIAFVNEGTAPDGTALADIQSLKLASGTASIWEPNYDTHTAAGRDNAISTYGFSEGDFDTSTYTSSKLDYYGVNSAFSNVKLNATSSSSYFSKVTPAFATAKDFSEYQSFGTLAAGITKYRVYMWVEGQDVDCENGASGKYIDFNLQLSINSSASGT